MKKQMIVSLAGFSLATMMFAGCATTSIVSEWRDPEVAEAGPYKTLFLAAVTKQDVVRRQMEDAFKDNIAAVGAAGIPSYDALAAAAEAKEEQLVKAVKASGADAMLVFRLMKRETQTSISPTYYGPAGYYNGYHRSWSGFYDPVSVYQYEVITLEASLFDVKTGQLVWAAGTETVDPGKLEKEVAAYAKLICERMRELNLVGAAVQGESADVAPKSP